MVLLGFKNIHQNDMCVKEVKLHAQNITILSSISPTFYLLLFYSGGGEELYDHLIEHKFIHFGCEL